MPFRSIVTKEWVSGKNGFKGYFAKEKMRKMFFRWGPCTLYPICHFPWLILNFYVTPVCWFSQEIRSLKRFPNRGTCPIGNEILIPSCPFMSLCVSMSFFTPISITNAFFASVCTEQFKPPSPNCSDPLQRSLIWDNFLTHDLNSSHDDFDDVQRVFCCCSCD